MPRESYYRKMFLVGAIWNWVVAGSSLVIGLFELTASDSGLAPGWAQTIGFFFLAVVFGLGYYWVSRDLHSNHGIVKMGIVGKVGVFFLFAIDFVWGTGPVSALLVGTGDLIFAILFIEFLNCYKTRLQPS